MGRSAILLIGTEKTGTTTLQHFLAANREVLRWRGFVYPSFCGPSTTPGSPPTRSTRGGAIRMREALGVRGPSGRGADARAAAAAAAAELAGDATAIFCSEHCHSRLKTPEEMATLRDFLGGFFDDIRVGVYLRRRTRSRSASIRPG